MISDAKNNQIRLSQDLSSLLPFFFLSTSIHTNLGAPMSISTVKRTRTQNSIEAWPKPFQTSAFYQSSTSSVCGSSQIYFSMLNNKRTAIEVLFSSLFTIYIVIVSFGTVFFFPFLSVKETATIELTPGSSPRMISYSCISTRTPHLTERTNRFVLLIYISHGDVLPSPDAN